MTLLRALLAACLLASPLAAQGVAEAGDLRIRDAYVFGVGPAPTAAAYMIIENAGASADRLLAVEGDVAARIELHDHVLEDGIARMRALPEGIPTPPGETVALAQGGLHVMLMGLAAPLEDGAAVDLTLVFERAGRVPLTAPVELGRGAGGHGHAGH